MLGGQFFKKVEHMEDQTLMGPEIFDLPAPPLVPPCQLNLHWGRLLTSSFSTRCFLMSPDLLFLQSTLFLMLIDMYTSAIRVVRSRQHGRFKATGDICGSAHSHFYFYSVVTAS